MILKGCNMRADIYFTGVISIVVGVVFFFMEAIMLTSRPDLIGEQLIKVALYGLVFKMVGAILMVIGIAIVIYGIFAKPTKRKALEEEEN
jgi:hypothetical protein